MRSLVSVFVVLSLVACLLWLVPEQSASGQNCGGYSQASVGCSGASAASASCSGSVLIRSSLASRVRSRVRSRIADRRDSRIARRVSTMRLASCSGSVSQSVGCNGR